MIKIKTPQAITHGHTNLCYELKGIIDRHKAFRSQAKNLYKVMSEHFEKEEKYALPPLGLLLVLSEGNWQLNEEVSIEMSESVKKRFNELKKEHGLITKLMQELKIIAESEDIFELKMFLNNLYFHMELEDQVLYPTTVLISNYLKKLKDNH